MATSKKIKYYQTYNPKIKAWVKVATWPHSRLDKIVKVKQMNPRKPWKSLPIK